MKHGRLFLFFVLSFLLFGLLFSSSTASNIGWCDSYVESQTLSPAGLDPLVIDLNRDGRTDLVNTAYFDLDANGFVEKTNWIDAVDGFLALDRNGDGVVNDGGELFGDRTIKKDGSTALNGFDALRDLDSNGDGVIDALDNLFTDLRVLTDVNGDGVIDFDELITLEEAGITSIDVTDLREGTNIIGGTSGQSGVVKWADGTTGFVHELIPKTNPLLTEEKNRFDISDDIAVLPDLHSAGLLYSLHQAMAREKNGELRDALKAYMDASQAEKAVALRSMLHTWAGVQGIDPSSRGGNIDARDLTFIEKFMGREFVGVGGSNPNSAAGPELQGLFASISAALEARLLMQTDAKIFFALVEYSIDENDNKSATFDKALTWLRVMYKSGFADLADLVVPIRKILAEGVLWNGKEYGNDFNEAVKDNPFFSSLFDLNLNVVLPNAAGTRTSGTSRRDLMMGSRDNDIFDGGTGDDVLIGGKGNDYLKGGVGTDVYIWNLGDGNDIIDDGDGFADTRGVLKFGEGVAATGIELVRVNYDVIFIVQETDERISIKNWYNDNSNCLARVEFADGRTWITSDVNKMVAGVTPSDRNLEVGGRFAPHAAFYVNLE